MSFVYCLGSNVGRHGIRPRGRIERFSEFWKWRAASNGYFAFSHQRIGNTTLIRCAICFCREHMRYVSKMLYGRPKYYVCVHRGAMETSMTDGVITI